MRDKEFKKLFKEEFKKENTCNVSLEDVIPNTNSKTLNDNLFFKYKKQQRISNFFAINSLVTVLILLISIIGFSIKICDYKTQMENIPVLSKEAEDFMIEYCGGNKIKLVSIEYFSENTYVKIYINSKKNYNSCYNHAYFFVTNLSNEEIIFLFNEEQKVYSNNKQYGVIGEYENCVNEPTLITITLKDYTRKIEIINEE